MRATHGILDLATHSNYSYLQGGEDLQARMGRMEETNRGFHRERVTVFVISSLRDSSASASTPMDGKHLLPRSSMG